MAHRYGESITVELAPDGQPGAFTWRGQRYAVRAIGTWKLAIGWWDPTKRVERTYYRCQDEAHGMYEIYHDSVGDRWVLDVVQD
jgi:hypothetical protein